MARPMTQEGVDAIQAEIAHLWHVERPEIVRQVHAAAEQGEPEEHSTKQLRPNGIPALAQPVRPNCTITGTHWAAYW